MEGTPEHLRGFLAPYHAHPHYEWSDDEEVRAQAGACRGCRLGQRRLPVLEDAADRRAAYGPWSLEKLGEWQSPLDGVEYSGRSLQALTQQVAYAPPGVNGTLHVTSPDAGIVRWGPVSPFPLPMPGAPVESGGASISLFSNSLINTNVAFWQPYKGGEGANGKMADFQWRFAIVLE